MDWLLGMNQAVDYIEENLDGTISCSTAAKFVCCSELETLLCVFLMSGFQALDIN